MGHGLWGSVIGEVTSPTSGSRGMARSLLLSLMCNPGKQFSYSLRTGNIGPGLHCLALPRLSPGCLHLRRRFTGSLSCWACHSVSAVSVPLEDHTTPYGCYSCFPATDRGHRPQRLPSLPTQLPKLWFGHELLLRSEFRAGSADIRAKEKSMEENKLVAPLFPQ